MAVALGLATGAREAGQVKVLRVGALVVLGLLVYRLRSLRWWLLLVAPGLRLLAAFVTLAVGSNFGFISGN
jgi:hypothetical protein